MNLGGIKRYPFILSLSKDADVTQNQQKIPPFDKLRASGLLSRKLNLTKYMNCNRAKKPPFILSLSKDADETQNQKNPTLRQAQGERVVIAQAELNKVYEL